MSDSPNLRIAVIGVGGIGSTFAFQLARAQHDVMAIARPGSNRLRQLQRDNGVVNVKGECAPMRVADALDETIAYDLVIVMLLAHQVDAVLPALQRSAAKRIQFMFNNFEPERLRDAIGPDRVGFGMPFVQATVDADGKLKATIGAAGQKTLLDEQRRVKVFVEVGLPAQLEADMSLWLRCHAPICVAFESVSVAGERRGGGASWREAMGLARGVHECFALIMRLGYRVYPFGKLRLRKSPVWVLAAMLWLMSRITAFRVLWATGVHECRALVDTMARAATGVHPPVAVATIEAMKPND